MQEIIIIGNGIAGITAARHIRKKSDFKITVISDETDYFFSRTALMYVYMGHMKFEHIKPYEDFFWAKNRINLLRGKVESVDFNAKKIFTSNSESIHYDSLIIATGSNSNTLSFEGHKLEGIQELYSYQDLQLMEKNTAEVKNAIIVGGGLVGIEMAEMLRSRDINVTILVREDGFYRNVLPKEESDLINRQIGSHKVNLKTNTIFNSATGDQFGRIKSVKIKDQELPCEFLAIAVGVHPNVDFLRNNGLNINSGVLVNPYLETNIPAVYAIGDCAEVENPDQGRKAIETAWYTGRKMGECVSNTICGSKTLYKPGIWFNSAKFFDLEYQTYGLVDAEPKTSFYWQNKSGAKAIRFEYDGSSRVLLGINALGIRLSHELCDQWLNDAITIDYAISNLAKALFEPEFNYSIDSEIAESFNPEPASI